MEKALSAFRTISEVADELVVPKHVLRFWEGKFPQLRPMKRGGGRRYYRPEDVDLLRGIRWLLYSDGYTIKGVQRILRDNGVRFVKECWREDADQSGSMMTQPAPSIPNLAGEAAEEARRTKIAHQQQSAAMRGKVEAKKSVSKASGVNSDRGDVVIAPQQRAFLVSLLNDLEDCRELLRAASIQDEAAIKPIGKKSSAEARRAS